MSIGLKFTCGLFTIFLLSGCASEIPDQKIYCGSDVFNGQEFIESLNKSNVFKAPVKTIRYLNPGHNEIKGNYLTRELTCDSKINFNNATEDEGKLTIKLDRYYVRAFEWKSKKEEEAEKLRLEKIKKEKEEKFIKRFPVSSFPLVAKISCGMYGNRLPLDVCLTNGYFSSAIEINNDAEYVYIQPYTIGDYGKYNEDRSFEIPLKKNFRIHMQNAGEQLNLGLEIKSREYDVTLYKKIVPYMGVISVKN
ncbi:hypothetical protein VC899_24575 [Citrobacter braakii]|uniref:hypothetical protein n=1 Tax=Citrobacter braakii TaxID=57706 RepID=UPI002B24DF67|nr:hypothetical protein [Citrobacter braakii]MEB0968323.1 hypothetical protein [Citrobacter braakii]